MEIYGSDLEAIWEKAYAWKNQYQNVEDDVNEQRTLNKVRNSINEIKRAVEKLEGKRRLNEAIELRRWQNAQGEEANHVARSYLQQKISEQNKPTADLNWEIAELSKLIERLAGEDQSDLLVDLKDNKLKPTLDKLTQGLVILAGVGDISNEFASDKIVKLKSAIFGKGFKIDENHQTVQIGEGGLYALRGDELRLREKRRDWEKELQRLLIQIERTDDDLKEVIQNRTNAVTEQVEANLTTSWNHLLILIGMAFLGFLVLTWVISRGIRRQVGALEQARSDADANHQKAESLLVEQRKAAEAFKNLSRYNELILNSAGEGIFGLDADGEHFIYQFGRGSNGWMEGRRIGWKASTCYPASHPRRWDSLSNGFLSHLRGD